MIPIPKELENRRNHSVLSYLLGASAHGDVAEELRKASSSLGDLGYFCPDAESTADKPVFNRTLALRDGWAKAQQKK